MQEIWIGILVVLVVGVLLPWIAIRRAGARKRYFMGGAADPLADEQPAPTDDEGNLRTVVEVDDFDPITPVHPDEIPRDPQIPQTGPAREGAPGWAHITDPPPTASDPSEGTDSRRRGPERGGE